MENTVASGYGIFQLNFSSSARARGRSNTWWCSWFHCFNYALSSLESCRVAIRNMQSFCKHWWYWEGLGGRDECATSLDQVYSDRILNKTIRTTMRPKWTFGDIWGHLGTSWNNSEDFLSSLEHLDCFPNQFRPFASIIGSLKNKSVRTTMRLNSEVGIWSLDHVDCFPSHFRTYSSIIGSFKKTRSGATDGQTHGPMDERTDPLIEMRGRI